MMPGEIKYVAERPGFKIMDTLPGEGPWELRAVTMNGVQTVIAVCPTEPPRFYQDGKLVQVGMEAVDAS